MTGEYMRLIDAVELLRQLEEYFNKTDGVSWNDAIRYIKAAHEIIHCDKCGSGDTYICRVSTGKHLFIDSPASKAIKFYKESIDASSCRSDYAVGFRNGLRLAISYLDGSNHEYEDRQG